LAGGCIGNEGCASLCTALQQNKTLTSFTIFVQDRNSEDNDAICEALAKVLSTNRTLRSLGVTRDVQGFLYRALYGEELSVVFQRGKDPDAKMRENRWFKEIEKILKERNVTAGEEAGLHIPGP
jgi:hypothetical protein